MRNFRLLLILFVCGAAFTTFAGAAPVQQDAANPPAQPSGSQTQMNAANPPAQANGTPTQPQDQTISANNSLTPESQDRLIREVRHELIMLPWYNVFDNLTFG